MGNGVGYGDFKQEIKMLKKTLLQTKHFRKNVSSRILSKSSAGYHIFIKKGGHG